MAKDQTSRVQMFPCVYQGSSCHLCLPAPLWMPLQAPGLFGVGPCMCFLPYVFSNGRDQLSEKEKYGAEVFFQDSVV